LPESSTNVEEASVGTLPKTKENKVRKNPAKEEIVDNYLARLKKIPCRYFEESIKSQRERADQVKWPSLTPSLQPNCRFGNDCHYAHIHPITLEPYVFSATELNSISLRLHIDKLILDLDELMTGAVESEGSDWDLNGDDGRSEWASDVWLEW
jgi:E3 ubiquitin-protein ligase makorin